MVYYKLSLSNLCAHLLCVPFLSSLRLSCDFISHEAHLQKGGLSHTPILMEIPEAKEEQDKVNVISLLNQVTK